MKIKLEYGKTGLWANIPDQNIVKVLTMKSSTPISNPKQALKNMLESPIAMEPLSKLAVGKKSACIVICDITRPAPNRILLPPILENLEQNGIPRQKITILIATGIHRPNLDDELIYLVGEEIAEKYRVVNHYAKEKTQQTYLGKTNRGTPVWINSHFVESDLKITTGFIEPHLMAGFSGGRKLICPGISSLDTVKIMHSPQILEHANAREGVIKGNPFHEEALEIAMMAGVDFIVNVALDEQRNITGLFAGHHEIAHLEGIEFVRQHVSDTVPEPVDVVVTTSAGFPLDTTFYQAVKGLTSALSIVKPGGKIILAAECSEGFGAPEFSQLVREVTDMNLFMQDIWQPDYFVIDQWQFEELAKVLRKVEVILIADGISEKDQTNPLFTWMSSVEMALDSCFHEYGTACKLAVIPKGPYILAGVSSK